MFINNSECNGSQFSGLLYVLHLNSELGLHMAELPLPTDLEDELHHHTED